MASTTASTATVTVLNATTATATTVTTATPTSTTITTDATDATTEATDATLKLSWPSRASVGANIGANTSAVEVASLTEQVLLSQTHVP